MKASFLSIPAQMLVLFLYGCLDHTERSVPVQFRSESGPIVPPVFKSPITLEDPEAM
jgi:hypothetical protein